MTAHTAGRRRRALAAIPAAAALTTTVIAFARPAACRARAIPRPGAHRRARGPGSPGKAGGTLTPEELLTLAGELAGAAADGDAESLAAIAWRLYGQAGEDLAEIGRLRAAVHAAWTRPQEPLSPAPAAACSGTAGAGSHAQLGMLFRGRARVLWI